MSEVHPSLPAAEAVERLIDQHGGRIYSLGLRMCGRPEDAEDLVQETFLRAFRKWHQFEGRSAASTWLYTIAARLCFRRKRRTAGEPRHMQFLTELAPAEEQGLSDASVSGAGPLEQVLRDETREEVERALTRLPIRFRMPLLLKELLELSVAEVAQILGLKQATVKTRLHRARLLLGEELGQGPGRTDATAAEAGGQVCLDLLRAKQEAMDRGVEFPVPPEELCARCRSLFAVLDLTHEACHGLYRNEVPDGVRQTLLESTRREPDRRPRHS